jgi:hypothetical protein
MRARFEDNVRKDYRLAGFGLGAFRKGTPIFVLRSSPAHSL